MKDMELCPVCGEGYLHPRQEEVEIEYKSEKHLVNTKFHTCDECDCDIGTEEDMSFNKQAVIDLRRDCDSRR
ncbi:TPA: hypothetical protein OUB92_000753 [Morganella morganii]|nr:hypothetical protein [Morganella morganii]